MMEADQSVIESWVRPCSTHLVSSSIMAKDSTEDKEKKEKKEKEKREKKRKEVVEEAPTEFADLREDVEMDTVEDAKAHFSVGTLISTDRTHPHQRYR